MSPVTYDVLIVAGAAIGAGDLLLLAICWKRKSVLAGVCAAVGIALVVLAIVSGVNKGAGPGELAIALVVLVVGIVLHGLGQAIWKLLSAEPEGSV